MHRNAGHEYRVQPHKPIWNCSCGPCKAWQATDEAQGTKPKTAAAAPKLARSVEEIRAEMNEAKKAAREKGL